jgi:hypothetical protein
VTVAFFAMRQHRLRDSAISRGDFALRVKVGCADKSATVIDRRYI